MIRKLIEAGVNVFRLNFSHGKTEDHGKRVMWIRDAEKQLKAQGKLKRPIKIMADVQGPKIRVGILENGGVMDLEPGKSVFLSRKASSTEPGIIPVTFPLMIDALKKGQRVLMDDGKMELAVDEPASPSTGDRVKCTVVRGGKLKNNKGINLPDVRLNVPALSEKDKTDIAFALSKGVDWIAISFVRSPEDMVGARQYVRSLGGKAKLLAKIEKPEAVEEGALKKIVSASDGVMVARGDLGIEMDVVKIPYLQELIIREARAHGRPVIVATQMLESMMTNNMPSRADVSDIADAVKDKANFLMLSGETAVGDYPVEAVQMMNRIIREYEPQRSTAAFMTRGIEGLWMNIRRLWAKLSQDNSL